VIIFRDCRLDRLIPTGINRAAHEDHREEVLTEWTEYSVTVVVVVMAPAVMLVSMATIPFPPTHIIAVDPMMMIPVARHPDIIPTVIPEIWSFIIRRVAD
jgi:hypothetical protein